MNKLIALPLEAALAALRQSTAVAAAAAAVASEAGGLGAF